MTTPNSPENPDGILASAPAADQAAGPPAGKPATEPAAEPAAEKKSAAALLVDLALERYDLGCTPDGEPYAVPKSGGNVVRMLRGGRTGLRAELAKIFRKVTGGIAGQQALAEALQTIEGEAADATPQDVHVRVAEADGATWIDLGDVAEHVVRVSPSGWKVLEDAEDVPVLFRRTALTGTLPVPEPGGSLSELWELLNVTPDDRPLVLGWLVAALGWAGIPHPMLALLGEQGTGKSSATKNLVQLVDPSPVPLRKPPRDADSWVTAASGSWVVGLDNLSVIPDWLSDALCRAVTGDGDVRRALYTDDGLSVFAFRRAIVMNGIDVGAMAGDLADRSIVVQLDRITKNKRRTETQLATAWETAWPRVFGALLDQVRTAKSLAPSVELEQMPRMADFAVILAALDRLHGTTSVTAYTAQADRLALDTITSDPFLAALTEHVASPWEGTAAELLAQVAPEDGKPPRSWPKTARNVTGVLKRNAPALRSAGWQIDSLGAANKNGVTVWRLTPPEKDRIPSPPTPPSPSPQVTALHVAGMGGDRRGTTPAPHPRPSPPIPANPKPLSSTDGDGGDGGEGIHAFSGDPCPDCGEPLTSPGVTTRCRPNHTTNTLENIHVA